MDFPIRAKAKGRMRVCLELTKAQNLKGRVLVDIGPSFGWLEKEIVNMGLKKIIGVEPNDRALRFARKNIPSAEFRRGNALQTGLPNSFSDVLILFDVIEHVPKHSENNVFDEARRILKRGGTLLLSTPYNHFLNNLLDPAWYFGHRHYSVSGIIDLLEKSGFKVERFEIKGKIFAPIYMIWFYINKWMFGNFFKNTVWLDKKYDDSYQGKGLHTIFIKAVNN